MRRFALVLLVLGFSTAGCGTDTSGGGGAIGDLEWPPDATAHFDEHGVLNADCATDEDCAMVLGYYHAFDRFIQMDFRRRFTTGRLADIFPKAVAETFGIGPFAARSRALFSARDGRHIADVLLEHSSEKTLGILEAYSAGVNQWIRDVQNGDNGASFPREFMGALFEYGPDDIPDWTPQDSLLVGVALMELLTNDEDAEIDAGGARDAIDDDDKFSDLWSRRPFRESAILPPGWEPPPPSSADAASSKRTSVSQLTRPNLRKRLDGAPVLRRLNESMKRTRELRRAFLGGSFSEQVGSNSWVIAPSRSTSGNALLSNDPHLGMSQPATWYLAHLDARTHGRGTIHTAGSTTAGLPWVIFGQNEDSAWGPTTDQIDHTDVCIEELVREDGEAVGVMFKGEMVPFLRVPFVVTFVDGSTVEEEILIVPHHGPIRSEIMPEDDVAISLRWTGSDADTDLEFLTAVNTATTVDEARQAFVNITTVGQNWVVADREGNIGWFPYGRVPARAWATNLDGDAPPWLPLDGRGDYEWTDYFEYGQLPQAFNPEEGFIATANNDMTGSLFDGDPTTLPNGDFHPPYQVGAAPGYRHGRIVDMIEEIGSAHTTDTMRDIVGDVRLLIGEDLTQPILDIATDSQTMLTPEGQRVVAALEDWNFTCPTGLEGTDADMSPLTEDQTERLEASGCMAFHTVLEEIRFRMEENENAGGGRGPSIAVFYSILDPSQLNVENKEIYWDNPGTTEVVETKFDVMREAFDSTGNFLIDAFGTTDQTQWAWGRLHDLLLSHDLSAFGIFRYDNPVPGGTRHANDGGLYTVDVAYPGPGDFTQRWGASTRLVCEVFPETGPSCSLDLPGGQSSDIDSPNYADLLPFYLRNEAMPLVFDIDEAAATAARSVLFQ
jgi:penicillin amidase